jgi:hypothetical protein
VTAALKETVKTKAEKAQMAKRRKLLTETAAGDRNAFHKLNDLANAAKQVESAPNGQAGSGSGSTTVARSSQPTMHLYVENEARKRVNLAIAQFYYENGISFNVADQPATKEFIKALVHWARESKYGDFTPPSSYPLRTTLLDECHKLVAEKTEVRTNASRCMCTLPEV